MAWISWIMLMVNVNACRYAVAAGEVGWWFDKSRWNECCKRQHNELAGNMDEATQRETNEGNVMIDACAIGSSILAA